MTDITVEPANPDPRFRRLRKPLLLGLTLLALALVLASLNASGGVDLREEALVESTLGKLAIWMADQSGNEPEEILSPLAQYADYWANELGAEELDVSILFASIRNFRVLYYGAIILLLVYAAMAVLARPTRLMKLYFAAILLLDALLFFVPTIEGSNALPLMVAALLALLVAHSLAPGRISRAVGFFLALSFLLVGWEASKAFANSAAYKILLPQPSWTYRAEPTMEAALDLLLAGDVDYVIADRKDLDDLMPPHPPKGDEASARCPIKICATWPPWTGAKASLFCRSRPLSPDV